MVDHGGTKKDISRRIAIAQTAFKILKKSKNNKTPTKFLNSIQMFFCMVQICGYSGYSDQIETQMRNRKRKRRLFIQTENQTTETKEMTSTYKESERVVTNQIHVMLCDLALSSGFLHLSFCFYFIIQISSLNSVYVFFP